MMFGVGFLGPVPYGLEFTVTLNLSSELVVMSLGDGTSATSG